MAINVRRAVMGLVLLLGTAAAVAGAACPGASSAGANQCIYSGDFSPIAGPIAGTASRLLTTNMYPFQRTSAAADLQRHYDSATAALTAGQAFRDSLVALVIDWTTPAACPGTTIQQHLFCNWSLNYETEGQVSLTDTNGDREPDLCTINGPLSSLTSARDTFAYQVGINWAPPGSTVAATRTKLLQTIRAIVDSYLIAADEFFIDSTEFRAANADANNLGTRLAAQRLLATKARLCYQGAIDAFLYGFSPAVGTNIYAADFFGERDTEDGNLFALFNLAVERWSAAWREEAAKRRAIGITSATADQTRAAAAFKAALSDNATQTCLLTAALAARQGSGFSGNGGPRLQTALDLMRTLGQASATGLNPLGYDDRFIPMRDFSPGLLEDARTMQANAEQSFQAFQQHRRDVDFDIDQLQQILQENANSVFKAQLATLTGVPLGATDFDTRVGVAGNNFSDCSLDLDNATFVTCMNGKAGGTLASKWYDRHRARQQWVLAMQRKASLLAQIDSENRQYGATLEIEHRNLQGVKDSLSHFLSDMENARTVAKSEEKYRDDVSGGSSKDSKGKKTTTTTTYYLRNDNLRLDVDKEIDMQNLLADYRIAQAGVQHQGNIEALLRQVVEQEIAIGLEVQNENAAALDFANLMGQRDDLIFQRARAGEHAVWSARRLMSRAAEARILRSREALRFQADLTQAARFSYLAAKALEYKYLRPLVNLSVGAPDNLLNLTDLYKIQDVTDLDRFNDKLDLLDSCPWGSIQPATVELSLVWDILRLTDTVIDRLEPRCAALPSPGERANCRQLRRWQEWQGYLGQHLSVDPETGRQLLRIGFSTSLRDPAIDWMGLYNAKAWYGAAPSPCDGVSTNGVAVNFNSGQYGTLWRPRVTIEQKGATTLGSSDGTVAEYIPVGEYLNMLGQNPDSMFGAKALLSDRRSGLFIGEEPDPGLMWSNGLKGRSVAASNWSIEVKDVGREAIDWSKLHDIVIFIDVIGSTQ